MLLRMKVDTISASTSRRESSSSIITAIMNPLFQHFRQSLSNSRRPSVFGSDKLHCPCVVLQPLVILLRVFGILPLSHHAEKCKFSHTWFSIPAIINYNWICVLVISANWLIPSLKAMIRMITTGTDFYTSYIMFIINVIASIVVYLAGSHSAICVTHGWDRFHTTLQDLALPNFKIIKRAVYLVPFLLLQQFISDLSFYLVTYSNDSLDIDNIALIIGGTSFIVNFVPNVICGTYAVVAGIIAIHFKAINSQVEAIMKECSNYLLVDVIDSASYPGQKFKIGNGEMVAKISKLKILHENLCDAVRYLEKSLGIQMLAVFIATGISFVAGIYSFIVISNELIASTKLKTMSYAHSISTILSGFRLLVVLVICQYLTNKANETGGILNAYQIENSSDEMKRQVDQFKSKIGLFPLAITCCNVFPMSASILASASGNIVTYVLVLMQFKLNSKSFPPPPSHETSVMASTDVALVNESAIIS